MLSTLRAAPALSLVVLALAACGDGTGPGRSSTSDPVANKVAVVELEGARPALYIQKGDGSSRVRIHFDGAVDHIPDQSPYIPRLEDDHILALGPVRWSPDGSRLAVVVTLAYDQSMVVVIDADGTDARVASLNAQRIMTNVDWSLDGKHLVYGMSTRAHARGVDVFVTDLEHDRVRRITAGYELGLGAAVRFDQSGGGIYLVRWTGEQGAPLFNVLSRVDHIRLADGVSTQIVRDVVGEIFDVSHDGTTALAIRHVGPIQLGDYDKALVRLRLGTGMEQVLVGGGKLQYARLAGSDQLATLVVDESTGGDASYVYYALAVDSGNRAALTGTGATTIGADVHGGTARK